MFSVTPSELITIGLIALIIFGPQRLPDLARKAGKVMAQLRSATDELRTELERDLGDSAQPLREVADELAATKKSLQQTVGESTKPFREAAGEFASTKKTLKETVEGQLVWVDKPAPPTTADDAPAAEPAPEEGPPGEAAG